MVDPLMAEAYLFYIGWSPFMASLPLWWKHTCSKLAGLSLPDAAFDVAIPMTEFAASSSNSSTPSYQSAVKKAVSIRMIFTSSETFFLTYIRQKPKLSGPKPHRKLVTSTRE